MIYIAICDDDKAICSQIENILLEYSNRKRLKIELSVFYSGESLIDFFNHGNTFDLIYLDIELENMNGVEVGRQIRKVLKNYRTEIVYISGNDGYDRQLFDVQPLHFIPKPITPSIIIEDFKLALERTQELGRFFKYQKGYDTYKIPISEIIYFESLNREIRMVSINGEDSFYSRLEDIALSVSKYQFLQIHRSYLINYNHAIILRYSEVVMSNGSTLPISRAKRQDFRNLQISEE
ncbi:MAG: LytTR family DNA-binding domain-containing protein [Anaerocolumna aminovalerica]|jgi:DNA-binding LytR/AlgR family response regulator|uniref:LytR/AlgR family response regulator transcription factor n=1 Tax=Anaerocolumna aminovalerica TaxID=1527 RepID=UPI00248CF21D|nr:LytTR family DNA-binding domain-containing protein [Anaerocolumna aminovalerica]MDU6266723.1 LytTR family DNA-binding domain-containing protein [Anaerocolumna aminovalerica]